MAQGPRTRTAEGTRDREGFVRKRTIRETTSQSALKDWKGREMVCEDGSGTDRIATVLHSSQKNSKN